MWVRTAMVMMNNMDNKVSVDIWLPHVWCLLSPGRGENIDCVTWIAHTEETMCGLIFSMLICLCVIRVTFYTCSLNGFIFTQTGKPRLTDNSLIGQDGLMMSAHTQDGQIKFRCLTVNHAALVPGLHYASSPAAVRARGIVSSGFLVDMISQ